MAKTFAITLAGLSFLIDTPSDAWNQTLKKRYEAFLENRASSDWRIHLRHDSRPPDPYGPWAIHDENQTRFQIGAHRGAIHLSSRTAEISTPSLDRAPSALARTIVFILTTSLPRERNGLLLHACGLSDVNTGKAFAFCGPSGAGKSTIAKLAHAGLQIMSDENVVVRLETPGPMLYSTPFWGQNTPESNIRRVRLQKPLAAIFILKQSPRWFLQPLRPMQAIMELLATEKVAIERPQSAQAWLDVAFRLVTQMPVYKLGFLPAKDLWSFLASQKFPFKPGLSYIHYAAKH